MKEIIKKNTVQDVNVECKYCIKCFVKFYKKIYARGLMKLGFNV